VAFLKLVAMFCMWISIGIMRTGMNMIVLRHRFRISIQALLA